MPAKDFPERSSSSNAQAPSGARAFQFSLRSLLAFMALVAIAAGVVFTKHWWEDERILLTCWTLGLIGGIAIGRRSGQTGILLGALGGGSGCFIASILIEEMVPRLFQRLTLAEYLMCSVPVGFICGAFAGAIYYLFLQTQPLRDSDRRWQRIIGGLLAGVIVASAIAWSCTQLTQWSPRVLSRVEFPLSSHPDTRDLLALAPSGRYVVMETENIWFNPDSAHISLDCFRVDKGRLTSIHIPVLSDRQTEFNFSGKKVLRISNDESFFLLYLDRSQQLLVGNFQSEKVQSHILHYDVPLQHGDEIKISPSGDKIYVCSRSGTEQRLETFATADLQDHQIERFPFSGRLLASPSARWLVKMIASGNEDETARVEVVRRSDDAVVALLENVRLETRPIFDAEEERMGIGDSVIKLPETDGEESAVRILTGEVVGLLPNKRAIVLRPSERTWKSETPFIRHWLPTGEFYQFCIVNENTGEVLSRSGEFPKVFELRSARDGHMLATLHFLDELRIWDVPP